MNQLRAGARDEHLAAVPNRQQTRDAVERRAEVVAVALVGGAGMHGRTNAQSIDGGEVFGAKRALGIEDRGNGIFGTRKGRAERVADGFEDAAAVLRDRRSHQRVVPAHRILHRRPVAVPARGAALDVAEHERYRARRCANVFIRAWFDHRLQVRRAGTVFLLRPPRSNDACGWNLDI